MILRMKSKICCGNLDRESIQWKNFWIKTLRLLIIKFKKLWLDKSKVLQEINVIIMTPRLKRKIYFSILLFNIFWNLKKLHKLIVKKFSF